MYTNDKLRRLLGDCKIYRQKTQKQGPLAPLQVYTRLRTSLRSLPRAIFLPPLPLIFFFFFFSILRRMGKKYYLCSRQSPGRSSRVGFGCRRFTTEVYSFDVSSKGRFARLQQLHVANQQHVLVPWTEYTRYAAFIPSQVNTK